MGPLCISNCRCLLPLIFSVVEWILNCRQTIFFVNLIQTPLQSLPNQSIIKSMNRSFAQNVFPGYFSQNNFMGLHVLKIVCCSWPKFTEDIWDVPKPNRPSLYLMRSGYIISLFFPVKCQNVLNSPGLTVLVCLTILIEKFEQIVKWC